MRMGILALGALLLSGCAGSQQVADDRQACTVGAARAGDAGNVCATVQAPSDPTAKWNAEEQAQRQRFISPLAAF